MPARTKCARARLFGVYDTLSRRNLLVNPRSLEELRALYDVSSESEAIRRAVDLALLLVTENDADLITWHSFLGDRSTLRIEPPRR